MKDDTDPATQVWIAEAVDWSGYRHPLLTVSITDKDILMLVCSRRTISKGLFRLLAKELGIPLKEKP